MEDAMFLLCTSLAATGLGKDRTAPAAEYDDPGAGTEDVANEREILDRIADIIGNRVKFNACKLPVNTAWQRRTRPLLPRMSSCGMTTAGFAQSRETWMRQRQSGQGRPNATTIRPHTDHWPQPLLFNPDVRTVLQCPYKTKAVHD